MALRELALFAGAGGGLLASHHLLGWRTRCAVEIDPYCQQVLQQRQLDGVLDPFPIWDDINTFDGRRWRGVIDVVSGGFPCQDISSAGRGAGLDGARSGLWFEMLRVIGEVQPAFVFAENSPNLRTRGLNVVVRGLAELGYECAWGVLGAWHVGAPHRRNRMWIVAAHSDWGRERAQSEHAEVAGAQGALGTDAADANGLHVRNQPGGTQPQEPGIELRESWWDVHRFAGVDDGNANRLDRVRATGNAQVCGVAALAWCVLHGTLTSHLPHWKK